MKMETHFSEILNHLNEDDKMLEIEEYFKIRKSDKLIKLGGLNWLINKWENIVERIPYSERYYDLEYHHDISIREILEDVKDHCQLDQGDLDRILEADKIFKEKTIKVNYIWSKMTAFVDPEKMWFCFRVPPERIPNWYSKTSEEMELYEKWIKESPGKG